MLPSPERIPRPRTALTIDDRCSVVVVYLLKRRREEKSRFGSLPTQLMDNSELLGCRKQRSILESIAEPERTLRFASESASVTIW